MNVVARPKVCGIRTVSPLATSEKEILASVVAHWRALGVPGSLVASIPNEASFGQAGLTRGLADLLVIAPGLPVGFLELKTERGRLSVHQEAFEAICDRAGVLYAVTYGRDEPIALLEAWKVVRPAISARGAI